MMDSVKVKMADKFTKKRVARVAAFAIAIGRALGLSRQDIRATLQGFFLEEMDSRHLGFAETSEILAALHESYDGTGFPTGLAGDEIPLGARILRVADALDALLTGRPSLGNNVIPWVKCERRYHRAVSILEAKEQIQRASGTVFDPKVVNALLGMPDWIWADLIQKVSNSPINE